MFGIWVLVLLLQLAYGDKTVLVLEEQDIHWEHHSISFVVKNVNWCPSAKALSNPVLRSRYGHKLVKVLDRPTPSSYHHVQMPFGFFLSILENKQKAFLFDSGDFAVDNYCSPPSIVIDGSSPLVTMGSAGTGIPFHRHESVWSYLVRGKIRWLLYDAKTPPPLFDGVSHMTPEQQKNSSLPQPYEVIQEPGQILYIPELWWHQTMRAEESLSFVWRAKTFIDNEQLAVASDLLQLKEFPAAVAEYQKYLIKNPHVFEAWNSLGIALTEMGRYNDAIDLFEKVTDIAPLWKEPYSNIVSAVSRSPPEDRKAAALRATALLEKTRVDEDGLLVLKEIVTEIEANEILLYKKIGDLFWRHNLLDSACDYYSKVADAGDLQAFEQVFEIRLRQKKYPEAIQVLLDRFKGDKKETYYALLQVGPQHPDAADELYKAAETVGVMLDRWQRPGAIIDHSIPSQAIWGDLHNKFPFINVLESNWKDIQEEAKQLLTNSTFAHAGSRKGSGLDASVVEGEWKEFVLYNRGKPVEEALKRCPKTAAILEKIPDVATTLLGQVQFSLVKAHSKILPHFGPTNFRLTCHLALIIPEETGMRVANQTIHWTEGKVLIFDDSYEHEVWNNSDKDRVCLIFNTWHPSLTKKRIQEILDSAELKPFLP